MQSTTNLNNILENPDQLEELTKEDLVEVRYQIDQNKELLEAFKITVDGLLKEQIVDAEYVNGYEVNHIIAYEIDKKALTLDWAREMGATKTKEDFDTAKLNSLRKAGAKLPNGKEIPQKVKSDYITVKMANQDV